MFAVAAVCVKGSAEGSYYFLAQGSFGTHELLQVCGVEKPYCVNGWLFAWVAKFSRIVFMQWFSRCVRITGVLGRSILALRSDGEVSVGSLLCRFDSHKMQ